MTTLKQRLITFLAASLLASIALPGLASAEICHKIDYTFESRVYDQVVLYLGNDYIAASDAACILNTMKFDSEKSKVGVYLAGRLYDQDNLDLLVNAVTFSSTKSEILKAGAAARRPEPMPQARVPRPMAPAPAHRPMAPAPAPAHRPMAPAPRPVAAAPAPAPHHPGFAPAPMPPRHIVQNVHAKIDFRFPTDVMEQVKVYVGDSLIYASDAAAIMRDAVHASYQAEIGAYLAPRLADRENIDLLLNVSPFTSVKDAIMNSVR